ncbi:outer membrane beta-barrel family protein [Riemerella columbina]|uniref:outer membrane beta-barrel family protein n=1 Tax=Riemerella columbina TaxID=103810 RepID=UPI00266F9788|nr:outer membrane beta-barrel family protein [Riemerella columbina]WKS95547.1 outer membrane beta-barrel family protein [Riemerella columbina]
MKKLSILLGTLAFGFTFAQEQKTDTTKTKKIEEVVITQKYIQQKADRLVYQVSASPVAKGNTAIDVLKKTPTISTTDGKEFKILGSTPAVIYINGRKANMSQEALSQLLKNTPSESILKIEVIATPGSEYAVEGNVGIINIELKRSKTDLFNGTLKMENTQDYYNNTATSLSLNYRKNKLGLSASAGYQKNTNHLKALLDNGNATYKTSSESLFDNPSEKSNFNLIADYELTDKSHLNFNFYTSQSWEKESKDHTINYDYVHGALQSIRLTKGLGNDKERNYSTSLYYDLKTDQQGSLLKLNVAYLNYHQHLEKNSDFYTIDQNTQEELLSHSLRQTTPQAIHNISSKADYIWKMKDESQLAFGGYFSNTKTDNDALYEEAAAQQAFIKNDGLSNHFIYTENIGALYANYSRNFGNQLSTKIGLRYETTATKGDIEGKDDPYYHFTQRYNNWLPFVNVAYQINDNHSLSYSFSSRVRRPSFWEINPVRTYTSETNFIQNNPFMKATTSYNQRLMYMFRNAYFFNLGHSIRNNSNTQIPLQRQVNNKTEIRYIRTNYGDENVLTASIGMQKAFFNNRWMNSLTLTGIHKKFSGQVDTDPISQEKFEPYVVSRTSNFWVLSIDNQVALNSSKNLWLDVDYFWVSPQDIELGRLKAIQNLSLALRKNWNNWTFKVAANDIFSTNSNINITNEQANGYYNNVQQYTYEREFSVSITYNFGNKKLKKVKEVESANSDIQSRTGKEK